MSFFHMFGNVGKGGSRDKNSQTDFDFDDAAADGLNIGIRVDPRPSHVRQSKPDRSRAKTPESMIPEKMLMAEKVFYGELDVDEQWNVNAVNSTESEHHEVKNGEKNNGEKDNGRDPCDPCQQYKQCMQECMAQNTGDPNGGAVEGEHVEEEKREVREGRSGRRPCNDPCRSGSRSREERKRAAKTEKPRRQCSDLCRVVKKRQEQRERVNDPCYDPCAPKDPCADPCQKQDPCADPCADPCMTNICEDPCCPRDPCADPCRNRQRGNPCCDPCQDPCVYKCRRKVNCCPDLCEDPCELQEPCLEPTELKDQDVPGNGAEAEARANGEAAHVAAEDQHKEACVSCPPCPPCPPCPQCPECPACPPCPISSGNNSYRPCGTSSTFNNRAQPAPVVTESTVAGKDSPFNQSYGTEEKPICPDPLFPSCKSSQESCQSLVCSEDS